MNLYMNINTNTIELTASICSRARAASFNSLSFVAFSCRIVLSLLPTLSLWRVPSSWFLMLVGLFDMKILQKSHHLFPWLTQNCTMRKTWNRHIYKIVSSSQESKHQYNYLGFCNQKSEGKDEESVYRKVTGWGNKKYAKYNDRRLEILLQ